MPGFRPAYGDRKPAARRSSAALRRQEHPLLVGAAVQAPLIEHAAVALGEAGNFDAQPAVRIDDPVISVRRLAHDVLLVAATEVGPLLHLRAYRRGSVGHVQHLAAVYVRQLVQSVAQISQRPFLVRLGVAVSPLIYGPAVRRGP